METLKRPDEHISAMMDGELSEHEVGLAMAALTEREGRLTWCAYHLIGDVLRSDASGADLGEAFNRRLAARLDVEVPPAVAHAPAPAPAPAHASAHASAPTAAPLPAAMVPALSSALTPGR